MKKRKGLSEIETKRMINWEKTSHLIDNEHVPFGVILVCCVLSVIVSVAIVDIGKIGQTHTSTNFSSFSPTCLEYENLSCGYDVVYDIGKDISHGYSIPDDCHDIQEVKVEKNYPFEYHLNRGWKMVCKSGREVLAR